MVKVKLETGLSEAYASQNTAVGSQQIVSPQPSQDRVKSISAQTSQVDYSDPYEKTKLNPEYIPTIAERTVINAIERANKKLAGIQAEFEFSIHEATKEIMVKVINKDTKEIIREIPPEKTLDMVAKMWELAGIIVDEKR